MSGTQVVYDRQVIPTGGVIFREGERGDTAYLIQSGEIEILKRLDADHEIQLAVLGPGRLFGEMALIDDAPRMASARAISPTTLILITPRTLEMMLSKSPKLIREMLHNLSNNLRNITNAKLREHPIRREPVQIPRKPSIQDR